MKREIKILLFLFLVCTPLVLVVGWYKNENRLYVACERLPRAYQLNKKVLFKVIKEMRADDYLYRITRNSDGTKLFLHTYDYVIVLSQDGTVKRIKVPATPFFMNDENDFVAWRNDDSGAMKFMNSEIEVAYREFGVDPSGQYFFVQNDLKAIRVSSIEEPDKTLISMEAPQGNEGLFGRKIFFKGGKLYFFYNIVLNGSPWEISSKKCDIYRRENGSFILKTEIQLPPGLAYSVIDLDPKSDNVLLLYQQDMPLTFLDSWHLYNLKTQKLQKLNFGFVKGYDGFFLEEALISNALSSY